VRSILQYTKNGRQIRIALIRSAPIQIKPFPKIDELCKYWRSKGYRTVIDVGCGKLRNALYLVNHFGLWITDFPDVLTGDTVRRRFDRLVAHKNFRGFLTPSQFAKRKLNADAAVLAFVLHTLPNLQMRRTLVNSAVRNTRSPHELFVGVPNSEFYYRQRMGVDNRLRDGYFFDAGAGSNTFYREYSAVEIDTLMKTIGFFRDRTFSADKKNQGTYIMRI